MPPYCRSNDDGAVPLAYFLNLSKALPIILDARDVALISQPASDETSTDRLPFFTPWASVMVSKQPVPSRAALNALRGVFLTTSCSFILLAEERRRRLQIARAALDNGRKLHTIQGNRGPVALAEAQAVWEPRFSEIDDDVLSMTPLPRPRTSTRRKGRSNIIGSPETYEDSCVDDGQQPPGDRRVVRGDGLVDRGTTKASIGYGFERVNRDGLLSGSGHAETSNKQRWQAQRSTVRTQMSQSTLLGPVRTAKASTGNSQHISEVSRKCTNDSLGKDIVTCSELAQRYLREFENEGAATEPLYKEAIPIVETLLRDLERLAADGDHVTRRSENIKQAIEVFNRLSSFGHVPPQFLRQLHVQVLGLIEAVALCCPENLVEALFAVMPIERDVMAILVPFMNIVQRDHRQRALHQTIAILAGNAAAYAWAQGTLVCRLLARYSKCYHDFGPIKKLFHMLQDAGLFREFDVAIGTEYKIRRFMTILSLEKVDDDFADSQLSKLVQMDSVAVARDIRLHKHFIVRKANRGQWPTALGDTETLARNTDPNSTEFRSLLTELTDAYSQTHSAAELESFIRKFTVEYRFGLKGRWIHAVLDKYASERRVDAVFAWLGFCVHAGVSIDAVFHRRFLSICRRYWNFSAKTIQRLEKRLLTMSHPSGQAPNSKMRTSAASEADKAARELRLSVMEHLKGPEPNLEQAGHLIQTARASGRDISEAITSLLLARLELGHDPEALINDVLNLGLRVPDSAFNKAAQALSARGDHQAAAKMCELAARENGQGELLYNEFNFANLVFAFMGSGNYQALQSLLSGFTSKKQWWHGSRACKESIKLAMKTAAMRAVAHPHDNESHQHVLQILDDALLHVKRCRPTKEDRQAVSEAYVRLVGMPLTKVCHISRPHYDAASGRVEECRHSTKAATTATLLFPQPQRPPIDCR